MRRTRTQNGHVGLGGLPLRSLPALHEHLLAFGRCKVSQPSPKDLTDDEVANIRVSQPVSEFVSAPADNFRRWWNNSWHVIEKGGPTQANDWTESENQRLIDFVQHAHALGYFIRFYTINGHDEATGLLNGYGKGYNTGSLDAAQTRWKAQIDAGVDFIATDQYESFHQLQDALGDE